jgi:hypothetical protein
MKLYTEEQVRQMLFDLGDALFNNCQNGIGEEEPETYFDGIIEPLTPIELPSDEEIENNAYTDRRVDDWEHDQQVGFEQGAKWMKEQILNQNK